MNETVAQLYSRLCIQYRHIHALDGKSLRVCKNCRRTETEHINGKCDNYCTSTHFLADDEQDLHRITMSLALLEQLAVLNSWSLT